MHERIFYRNLVIGLLTCQTNAGAKVFNSRVIDWDAEDLPGISVYTPSQQGTNASAHKAPSFDNVLTLNIETAVVANDAWADELDNLTEQIENRLFKSNAFLSEISSIESYATTINYASGGEFPVASAVMSLGLTFRTHHEPVYPDDYNTTAVDLKVGENAIVKAKYNMNE